MAGLKKTTSNELDKVLSNIADEEMRTLNQVYVDEDGIVRDEPLIAGYVDENGVRHSTFSYREMNGKDEEAINKADVRNNGGRLMNTLLERCVLEIGTLKKSELGSSEWGKVIRNLKSGDQDYMALKIREISKGEEIEFTHVCPKCNNKLTTIVTTDEIGIKEFKGVDPIPFTLPRGYKDKKGQVHKEGTIRLSTGFDQEIIIPLFRKNPATAITMLLTRTMTFNDNAIVTTEQVGNMTVRDREYLEKLIKENAFGLDTHIEIECSNCGADLSSEVGQSNFF